MAKVHAPLQIQGAIGTIVISGTQRGGQRAYLKPHFNKERWRTHPRLRNSRASAVSFGGAAMCGSAIYKGICYGKEGQIVPYAHNQIARRLRKFAEASIYTTRYAFAAAQDALRNLDLSPEGSPTRLVRIQQIGPGHAPTHLRVDGLRDAASEILRDSSQLQCRVTCRSMAFPAVGYDAESKQWRQLLDDCARAEWQSLWIPIDLVPGDGLLVPIPAQTTFSDEPQLHFAIVEWRQVAPRQLGATAAKYKSTHRQPKLLRDKTVVRLAAFGMRLETTEQRPLVRMVNRCYRPARVRGAVGVVRVHLMATPLYLRLALRGT